MAITLLDIVKSKVGDKPTGEDFEKCHLALFSGCQGCEASLGPWNAYPSKTGFIRCGECIDDLGFDSVEAFEAWQASAESLVDDDN